MTEQDKLDWWLLGLANSKGKFALELGVPMDLPQQLTFERGIDMDWFTLVDLSNAIPAARNRWMRVFKLTAEGAARLAELQSAG